MRLRVCRWRSSLSAFLAKDVIDAVRDGTYRSYTVAADGKATDGAPTTRASTTPRRSAR